MASANNKAAILAKYRTTERFEQALEIIEPDSSRREECGYDVATALWGIDHGANRQTRIGTDPGAVQERS
jgi:hypothetical protein